jgi:hypothetical protein
MIYLEKHSYRLYNKRWRLMSTTRHFISFQEEEKMKTYKQGYSLVDIPYALDIVYW